MPRLVAAQVGYAARDLWRSRIAMVFTFLFPLTFLLVIGAMAGNATISADSTVRIMQFVTPSAAVMGALYGAFPTVASSLADARERGVLKRIRGTPLPMWMHLLGRVIASAAFAFGSLGLMLLVGVIAYDVQIQWATMPATVVTSLLAVSCFAALGVAVAGLARSASLAQAVSIAVAVVLSFLSGLMGYGDLPAWADRVAVIFPVKHFNDALAEQFDPFATGSGWDLGAVAVIAAWLVVGIAVATRTLGWQPVHATRTRPGARRVVVRRTSPAAVAATGTMTASQSGRPGWPALLRGQAEWATKSALRDLGWVFFTVALPIGLFAFNAAIIEGPPPMSPPLEVQLAAGMMAWAAVVTGLVNLPEAFARARERGQLKRLRGTPLPIHVHLEGRWLAALGLVLATAVSILALAAFAFDIAISAAGVPLALGLLVLGTASLSAIGFLLASIVPTSQAVTAVGLGIALPLSFFSDVFTFAGTPDWMGAVGSILPLKHLANSMSAALDPAGVTVSWVGITVMVGWLVVAGALAVRRSATA